MKIAIADVITLQPSYPEKFKLVKTASRKIVRLKANQRKTKVLPTGQLYLGEFNEFKTPAEGNVDRTRVISHCHVHVDLLL